MEMKHALFALLLLGYAFAGLAVTDYTVSPDSVEPGGAGYVTFTLSNPSTTDTVSRVTVTVSSANATPCASLPITRIRTGTRTRSPRRLSLSLIWFNEKSDPWGTRRLTAGAQPAWRVRSSPVSAQQLATA